MLYLASDHAGFELKKEIVAFLKQQKIRFVDVGPHSYDPEDDYPDFIIPAAQKVAENPQRNKAIILGGSGQGEAIAANKVRGVRAAVFYGGHPDILTLSKEHNDANILSLGARFLSKPEMKRAITKWLSTRFPRHKRHVRRIEKIKKFEEQHRKQPLSLRRR
jgi:ribose 5-phosphate isomerase B